MKKDLNLLFFLSSVIGLAEAVIYIHKKLYVNENISINFFTFLQLIIFAILILSIILILSFLISQYIGKRFNKKLNVISFLSFPIILYYLSWLKYKMFYGKSLKEILSYSKIDLGVIFISLIIIFLGAYYSLNILNKKISTLPNPIEENFSLIFIPLIIFQCFLLIPLFKIKTYSYLLYKISVGFSIIIFLLIAIFICKLVSKLSKKNILLINVIFILAIILALLLNNQKDSREFPKYNKLPNIIIISIDALRRDYLSCYNIYNAKTPNIDSVARDGVIFDQARSTSSWTTPSFSSIVSSLYPSAIGQLNSKGTLIVPFSLKTFPEILKDEGYNTYMFIPPLIAKKSSGISQGIDNIIEIPHFEWYEEEFKDLIFIRGFFPKIYHWEASYINHYFFKSFPQIKKPFFVWLHYLDVHTPYILPEIINNPLAKLAPLDIRNGSIHLTHSEKEEIKKLYSTEVEYVDKKIGEIINLLKRKNLYDNSIIIITADHGEEFWDHGNFMHGHSLYDEILRIPFIIKFPNGYMKNYRTSIKVNLLDIAPTILSYLNISAAYKYQGINLLDAIRNPHKYTDRIIFAENTLYYHELKAVIYKDYKLILSDEKAELYNLENDPNERNSIHDLLKIKELAGLILQWQKNNEIFRIKYHLPISSFQPTSPEYTEMLKALGYIK